MMMMICLLPALIIWIVYSMTKFARILGLTMMRNSTNLKRTRMSKLV